MVLISCEINNNTFQKKLTNVIVANLESE